MRKDDKSLNRDSTEETQPKFNMTNTTNLQVLPLREIEDKSKKSKKIIHPNLPKIPFLCSVVGATGTGKTVAISNLLLNKYMFGGKPHAFDRVYIFSPSIYLDNSAKHLLENFTCFAEYNDTILDNILKLQQEYEKEEMPNILIVLDDSIGTEAMARSSKISFFLSRYRHWNCSVIISVQHFRSIVSLGRANATDAIIFNIPNAKELEKIDEEWGAMYQNQFLSLYLQATDKQFGFLYLKLRKIPPEAYRNFTEKLTYKTRQDLTEEARKDPDLLLNKKTCTFV